MKHKVIDLFAGAGGLSNGFEQTKKFEIVIAVENNKKAQNTYKRNHKNTELFNDVRNVNYRGILDTHGEIDVVIGGPPCQGFSNANRQRNHLINSNNQLVKEYIRAILDVKPKVFVLENVSMLRSDKHKFYYSNIDKDAIDKLGLEMKSEILNIDLPEDHSDRIIKDIMLGHIYNQYILPEKVFKPINIIYKQIGNREKFKGIIEKKKLDFRKSLEFASEFYSDFNDGDYNKLLYFMSIKLLELCTSIDDKFCIIFSKFVLFQRLFIKLEELNLYKILVDKYCVEDHKLQIHVQSYTVIDYILKALNGDYKTKDAILNAAHYGVPQVRERFIMLGVRSDSEHLDKLEMPTKLLEKEDFFTVKDAIKDLESYEPKQSFENSVITSKNNIDDKSRLNKYLNDSDTIYNHVNTNSTDTALERFKHLNEGENFHDLDNSLKTTYSLPERTQNSIYLRLSYNKPSGTVLNVRKSMWIHPKKDRALSIREAARLQTFPDSFIFEGTKDSQYQQIGNAVPPLLGRAIAQKVLELLGDEAEVSIVDVLNN